MEPLGTPRLITLHWTAFDHTRTFSDYHFCVQGDGTVVRSLPIVQKGAHCWGRNTGNIGVSMCAMGEGFPVTPVQVEHTAKLCAELCLKYGFHPTDSLALPRLKRIGRGTPDDRLAPDGGWINSPVIADHAYFAKADGYYPDRWDVGQRYPEILKKTVWYYEQMKAGKAKPEFIK